MTIGHRIFQLKGREKTKDFADRFGVTVSQVSRYLANESQPSFEVAMAICDFYECSLDWLIRGVGEFKHKDPSKVQEPQAEYVSMNKYVEVLEENRKLLLEKVVTHEERIREQTLHN